MFLNIFMKGLEKVPKDLVGKISLLMMCTHVCSSSQIEKAVYSRYQLQNILLKY